MATLLIPEDKVQQTALQACQILMKLRLHTKKWEAEHGGAFKQNKKIWEAAADNFLESLDIEYSPGEVELSGQGLKKVKKES